MTVPLRAALYLRVSTARQAEHDVSILDQKRQGEAYCAKCGGAMTIRTGKGGRYRYYACSMKARQGPTACDGMAIPMEKLDDLVASHLEDRLLQPERLETILATVLDRRQERSERQQEHIAELNRRAAESEARLKRLYDAIEAGVADLDDPALKDRIDGLKAIRDQAKADAERAQAMLQNSGRKAVTPQMLSKFARTARQRIRLEGGGYRRDHLRALAQRVEVADGEVRIMGSKSRLLQALVANGSVNSVPIQGLKWRTTTDDEGQYVYAIALRWPSSTLEAGGTCHTTCTWEIFHTVLESVRSRSHLVPAVRKWTETRGRHPYLTAQDAEDLVAQSITAYKTHHRHVPARVVVLKTSRFRPEEAEGIDAALEKFGIEMSDLVWVQESSPIAIFRDGNYPVLRGTFVDLDGKGLLYTRGSVPFYGTYAGLRVPRPLLLVPHENSDSKLLTLAKDVLALTKVNWNTTQFDQKLPAPIKAAREVGRILKHVDFGTAVSPDFRRYS